MGTRLDATHVGVGCTDHPHACGDKAAVKLFKLVRDVSSPRVWGQGLSALGFRLFLGIIPTRVGTRQFSTPDPRSGRDHPHACGDKRGSLCAEWHRGGSSPRVWGQVDGREFTQKDVRIIPTRVGTRCFFRTVFALQQDHPHACGDKIRFRNGRRTISKSSPRVWGQDICVTRVELLNGIIPTRVGTSIPSKAIMCRS